MISDAPGCAGRSLRGCLTRCCPSYSTVLVTTAIPALPRERATGPTWGMIVRYGCGSCAGPGPRWVMEDCRATDTTVPAQTAGWRDGTGSGSEGVHGSGVRADQRLRLAVSAADVRHLACHRASPVRGVDQGRSVAPAAPGGPGRTRCQRYAGLDLSDHRRRVRPWEKGSSLTGPNPVDRGKKGSKPHVLSEAQGIPLADAVSGANVHDSQTFKPPLLGLPAIRSRRGPRRRRPVKVRADKAYHSAEHLAWLRSRGLTPRIARPGIESGEPLPVSLW